MTFISVKLEDTVTFMKYLAIIVFLIFLPKTLICNKMSFSALNSLNFTELLENKFAKSISK